MRLPWKPQSRALTPPATPPGAGRRAADVSLPAGNPALADGLDAKTLAAGKKSAPFHPVPSSPRSESPRIGAHAASPLAAIVGDHAMSIDHRMQLLIPLLADTAALARPATPGQSPVELAIEAVRGLPTSEQRADAVALASMVAAATSRVDPEATHGGRTRAAEPVLGRALAAALTLDPDSREQLAPALAHVAVLAQGGAANRELVGQIASAGAGADLLGAAAAALQATLVGLTTTHQGTAARASGTHGSRRELALAANSRRNLAEASEGPHFRAFLDGAHNDLALFALAHLAGIAANPAGLFRDGLVVEDLAAHRGELAKCGDNPAAQRLLMTLDVYAIEHPASSREPYSTRVRTLAGLLRAEGQAPSLAEVLGRHELAVDARAADLDPHLQPAALAALNVPGGSPVELAVAALATAQTADQRRNAVAMATLVAGRTHSALVDPEAGSPVAEQMFTRALHALAAVDPGSAAALGGSLTESALLARGTGFLAASAQAVAATPGDVWTAATSLVERTLPAPVAGGGLGEPVRAHAQRCTVDLALAALARRAGLEPPSEALFLRDNKILGSLAQRREELVARAGHPDADTLLLVIDTATATVAHRGLTGDALTGELARMLGG